VRLQPLGHLSGAICCQKNPVADSDLWEAIAGGAFQSAP